MEHKNLLRAMRNKKENKAVDKTASKALKVTHLIHEIDNSYLFNHINLSNFIRPCRLEVPNGA